MHNANITPIQKHLLVSVKIKNAAITNQKLDDLNTLKGKKVTAIVAHNINDISVDADGNALANAATFKKSYLVLKACNNSDKIDKIPLNLLYPGNNDGKIVSMEPTEFDYTDSYVYIATSAGVTVNEVFLFSVFYED